MTQTPTGLTDLIQSARRGDERAWTELVTRFQPLIDSTIRRHRIDQTDGVDVSQTVWVTLLSQIGRLREPEALPGWIATTTARACLNLIAGRRRTVVVDPVELADRAHPAGPTSEMDAVLERYECADAIRTGLSELPKRQRDLLGLLLVDPPLPYAEISRQLGVPVGSIGPTRARGLQRLSRSRAVRRLTAGEPGRPMASVA